MREILVMGRRWQGKTTLAFFLARELEQSIVVFDPNDQFCFPDATVVDSASLCSLLENGVSLIIYRVPVGEDVENAFAEMAAALWSWQDLTMLIDESSILQNANYLPMMLGEFVRRGRDVNLVQTFHRPSDVAKICRAMATDWYLFATTDRADLAAFAEVCGEDAAAAVAGCGRFEFVHVEFPSRNYELVQDSDSWRVPLAYDAALEN